MSATGSEERVCIAGQGASARERRCTRPAAPPAVSPRRGTAHSRAPHRWQVLKERRAAFQSFLSFVASDPVLRVRSNVASFLGASVRARSRRASVPTRSLRAARRAWPRRRLSRPSPSPPQPYPTKVASCAHCLAHCLPSTLASAAGSSLAAHARSAPAASPLTGKTAAELQYGSSLTRTPPRAQRPGRSCTRTTRWKTPSAR